MLYEVITQVAETAAETLDPLPLRQRQTVELFAQFAAAAALLGAKGVP